MVAYWQSCGVLLCSWVWWSAGVVYHGVAGAAGSPGFLVCFAGRADRMYIPIGGKAPSFLHPLRCIAVFPMGAPGCSACVVVVSAGQSPWLGFAGCQARCVLCRAALRGSGGVCVGASVRLPEVRVVWLGGTPVFSVAWPFSGPPVVVTATSVL